MRGCDGSEPHGMMADAPYVLAPCGRLLHRGDEVAIIANDNICPPSH